MARVSSDPAAAPQMGRRESNRLARERAYLDAGMRIAAEVGIVNLTMSRLAEEVDAAIGTVYTYFPSKGALIAELQREAIERLSASYHLIRDRSAAVVAAWDDPAAAAVARLEVFGRFWIESVEAFPHEAAFLHGLIAESSVLVPPEEHHRVLPAALDLLGEAREAVEAAAAVGAIDPDDPMDLVIRWAAALTGALLTSKLAPLNATAFDGARLARLLQRDLLIGWGATPDLVDRAEAHVAELAAAGPLAPPLPADA